MDRRLNSALAIGIVSLVSVGMLIVVLHYGERLVTDSIYATAQVELQEK